MDQTAQSWIGKQIGQYTIQSLIKKGGMAYVYYAIDQALERPVALKILFKNLTQDQTFIERFRREARAVAKLRHPNIVQIYTTGETPDGEYYIAMEYISGGSLREQLDRLAQQGHVLQTTESLKIVEQVASALVASHQANIIHRDLKPSNILLRTNGTPVITDLGIAKMQNEATLTRLDELVGTPYYMSPEQVNSQPVDGRSDIYSLGMILYEMLSGRRAFTGDTPWAILSKHITETPQPISQLRPDISAQTATMVHTCLQKEPASRYQTAADLMLAAKQAIQSEQTGQAASLGAATYAAATVVAAAAPETMVGATRVGESPTVVRAPQQKRPFSPFWLIPVFLALLLGCAAAAIFFTPLNEMLFGGETAVPLAIITTIDSATATQPSTTEPTANNPTVANTEIAVIETTPTETDAIPAEDTPVPTKPPKQTSTPKPTSTESATAAPTPTKTPGNPSGGSSQGGGLPLTFEPLGVWIRGDEENGSLTSSTAQAHSGAASAKLSYAFTTADNDYVVFMQNNAIPGEPTALQIWVYGDGAGHYLNAWIQDNQNQTWQVPFGRITHTGWKQMTGYINTGQDWPWTHISGPKNDTVEYPISFRALVLDDLNNAFNGSGEIFLDDLTPANLVYSGSAGGGDNSGGGGDTGGGAAGDVGRILYTSGNSLLTTDPAWSTPQEVGTAVSNTCSSPATTNSGSSFNLYYGPFCNISGGVDVCAAPNGQVEVVVNKVGADFSITTRPPASDNFTFVYQGSLDTAEGIRWSPTSDSFLFVVGDTVHRAFPNGNYAQIIPTAFTPSFSPDGSQILYLKPVGPGVRDVFVSSADGSNQKNVTNVTAVDKTCPAWRR